MHVPDLPAFAVPAVRSARPGAVLLLAALAATAACATRPAAPAATTAATAAQSSSQESAPATPAASRPLPPVSSGGMVAERQTASVPLAAGAGSLTGPMAGSIAELGDRVFFETDSSALGADSRALLERQAAWMQANPGQRFLVAGNADERGTREYNLALGARRASAVRDYLVSLGIAPGRIETVSYGKERPIDPRPNPDGWAMNRNAHTGVLGGS